MKPRRKPVVLVEVYKGLAEVSENTGAEAIILDWDALDHDFTAEDIKGRMDEIRKYLPQNKNRKRILDGLQERLVKGGCCECGGHVATIGGGKADSGIICTECYRVFCDNCYDTGIGDGCKCHR